MGEGRVGGDAQADPGHTRRVGHGQAVPVQRRDLGVDGQFAPNVQGEGPVLDLQHLDALHLAGHACYPGGVLLRLAEDHQVAGDGGPVGGHDVDGDQAAAGPTDGGGQRRELTWTVRDTGPDPDGEGGEGDGHASSLAAGAPSAPHLAGRIRKRRIGSQSTFTLR